MRQDERADMTLIISVVRNTVGMKLNSLDQHCLLNSCPRGEHSNEYPWQHNGGESYSPSGPMKYGFRILRAKDIGTMRIVSVITDIQGRPTWKHCELSAHQCIQSQMHCLQSLSPSFTTHLECPGESLSPRIVLRYS